MIARLPLLALVSLPIMYPVRARPVSFGHLSRQLYCDYVFQM